MTIGEKLKELRKIADKTVAKVAEDSGILPARVSFYEMDIWCYSAFDIIRHFMKFMV